MIVGITRVRNESLIIADTLRHYLRHCDHIVLFDDASTDKTPDIAANFPEVTVLRSFDWRADRQAEETRHRALLLDAANNLGADWVLCFDADERLVGELPELTANGYRFRLFDGYMTADCSEPYEDGPLTDLPRKWGPEYRDILMLFRPDCAEYIGRDMREPIVSGDIRLVDVQVKHYGKCLSVSQWEETCAYYAEHFPEPYRSKWRARKGKAIHEQSDFGRPLYNWDELPRVACKL